MFRGNLAFVTFIIVPCKRHARPLDTRSQKIHETYQQKQQRHRIVCQLNSNIKQERLQRCANALKKWHSLTNYPSFQMPTDSQVRQCDIAQSLRLGPLINQAGGFRHVREQLNLTSIPSRMYSRQKELTSLANRLENLCERLSHPSPRIKFPSREFIRTNDPALGNQIAAYKNKAGFSALAKYFQSTPCVDSITTVDPTSNTGSTKKVEQLKPRSTVKKRLTTSAGKIPYGKWADNDYLMELLQPFQPHVNVMPSIGSIPKKLASAIQRKGGSRSFSRLMGLVEYQNYLNVERFRDVCHFLASNMCNELPFSSAQSNPESYCNFILAQSKSPPSFPKNSDIPERILKNINQIGDKRGLAIRLGYPQTDSNFLGWMGPFSIQLAFDILDFTVHNVTSVDGNVAMPTTTLLKESPHIVSGIELFGGQIEVSRRLGLIYVGDPPKDDELQLQP